MQTIYPAELLLWAKESKDELLKIEKKWVSIIFKFVFYWSFLIQLSSISLGNLLNDQVNNTLNLKPMLKEKRFHCHGKFTSHLIIMEYFIKILIFICLELASFYGCESFEYADGNSQKYVSIGEFYFIFYFIMIDSIYFHLLFNSKNFINQ